MQLLKQTVTNMCERSREWDVQTRNKGLKPDSNQGQRGYIDH